MKRSAASLGIDRMLRDRSTAAKRAAADLLAGRVFAPPPAANPPAASPTAARRDPERDDWAPRVQERLTRATMRAALSGVDRQVLDAIVLKLVYRAPGCVRGRLTPPAIAQAIGRTEQAVRLSLKRLAGIGLVHLSFNARRQVAGVLIHQSIMAGEAAEPVDNSPVYPQAATPAKKIFRKTILSSPPKPPTTLMTYKTDSIAAHDEAGREEKGDAPAARPVQPDRTDALTPWPLPARRHENTATITATAQGIQQRALSPPPALWAG